MNPVATTEKRQGERIALSLSAVVKAKEDKDTYWKEQTQLISMSRSGAGFYLGRHCDVGQLVSLIMAMPRHLRCYDADKELYRVWGLVQHCSPISGGAAGYHVGVAFVGKHSPASYHRDPMQSYRIIGINGDGLWKIVEAERPFVTRRYPRFHVSLNVTLSMLDENDEVAYECTATTENVSLRGAAVFSDINANVGDCVRFTYGPYDFSVLAVVRNRQLGSDGLNRVHLEFVTGDFPIRLINFPAEIEDSTTAETETQETV